MTTSRRNFFKAAAGLAAAGAVGNARLSAGDIPIASGPYSPEGSFQSFQCPGWFRDAKFGIWAHWGPQCVPEQGDWYARGMYVQGSSQYNYHVKTYGHPSQFGYKDICHIWKAEELEPPEELIRLYAKTGAKYFVALGNHHDNFDCWNSRGHRWNSVKMGPKRDIVGEWARAAREAGLRFGVSEHVWASYNWWTTNKGSDNQGAYAGVPYDGTDPANYDLYFPPHTPGREPWAEQGNESEAWNANGSCALKT